MDIILNKRKICWNIEAEHEEQYYDSNANISLSVFEELVSAIVPLLVRSSNLKDLE